MTVPNSLVVIVPSPSLSNREKASLNSAICSSVSWSAMFINLRPAEGKDIKGKGKCSWDGMYPEAAIHRNANCCSDQPP